MTILTYTAVDIPLHSILTKPESYRTSVDTYIVCRLGNDSQLAADALRNSSTGGSVKDMVGGLVRWAKDVDPCFPVY
jgi:adenylyltransferase and sulfurtransferase